MQLSHEALVFLSMLALAASLGLMIRLGDNDD